MTSPASGASSAADLPDYAPIPLSALGPALNEQGYYVGRVERNLYWVDGVYQSAFLTTDDGVVLFDAPPTIRGNLRRAVDEMAAANGDVRRGRGPHRAPAVRPYGALRPSWPTTSKGDKQ